MVDKRVCLVPQVQGVGGMVSFRHKLTAGLEGRGVQVCDDLRDLPYQSVLVIGGTRQLGGLWRARRRGVRIVQRLDGMNWLHKVHLDRPGARLGLRHSLYSEIGNLLLSTIRNRLAQYVVYQSQFSKDWWERVHGATRSPNTVVYNGVDLLQYTPDGSHERPEDCYRLLMVEGSLMGGYETGLETGVRLVELLNQPGLDKPVELMVVGRVAQDLQQVWNHKTKARVLWAGLAGREEIPALDRSAHVLFSSDLNAACPNSAIEALACGLPVIAFDTGALPELVNAESGRVVPYGGDVWKLDAPDLSALAQAAREVIQNQAHLRLGARQRAEQNFGLDSMVEKYLQVLFE